MRMAAMILGLGAAGVVAVDKKVRRVREEGCAPLFVCATAGTTVLGSLIQPKKWPRFVREGLWLHVDSASGGFFFCWGDVDAVAFSERLGGE